MLQSSETPVEDRPSPRLKRHRLSARDRAGRLPFPFFPTDSNLRSQGRGLEEVRWDTSHENV